MLVLTRKKDESIIIGDNIEIVVTSIENGVVKLGIKADKKTKIYRKEVYEQIKQENTEALIDQDVLSLFKK